MSDQTIVVVDDDRAVRDALDFAFQAEGFSARSYRTAEEALADQAPAACYVVDYDLPGMNGIGLIKALRGKDRKLRAIMITGKSAPSIRYAAQAAGIRLVDKPLLGGVLIDAVKAAVANA